MMRYQFEPIGVLNTCFKEKFGIPRQPGLIREAKGVLKLKDHPFFITAIRELEGFSHLWVVFVFHQHDARNWKPSIRPPRLGGARKVGVLASRSPHRPNPIGLSVMEIEKIDIHASGGAEIHLNGVDVLDGTPVLDIKPYIPYADSVPMAKAGWAEEPIERHPVQFSEKALEALKKYVPQMENGTEEKLKDLIVGMLELDPRPAFQKRRLPAKSIEAQGTRYGFRLHDMDVKWEILDGYFYVHDIVSYVSPQSV